MIKRVSLGVLVGVLLLAGFWALPVQYHITVTQFKLNGSPEEAYNKLILGFADSNDTVVVHVNSPGGSVVSLIRMANNIENSRARIITINEAMALSAGGVIALLGDDVRCNKYSVYLFHKPRYISPTGKIKLAEDDNFISSVYNEILDEHVLPRLTKEERKAYLEGQDVTIKGKELVKRIEGEKAVKELIRRALEDS